MEYENLYGDEAGLDDALRWMPEGVLDDECEDDFREPGWELDELSDEGGPESSVDY
jgi:hypothetical protein